MPNRVEIKLDGRPPLDVAIGAGDYPVGTAPLYLVPARATVKHGSEMVNQHDGICLPAIFDCPFDYIPQLGNVVVLHVAPERDFATILARSEHVVKDNLKQVSYVACTYVALDRQNLTGSRPPE